MRRFIFALLLAACATASSCSKDFAHHMASGDDYFKQKKFAEAAVEYANASVKDPSSGIARFKLAETYMASGNTKAAFPQYIRAADLLPDNLDAQFKAGYLLLKAGLFTDAKTRARTVLQKDPKNVSGLLLLANALAGLKSLDEALAVLQRALVIDPERAGIYTNLGVLQLAQGDRKEAEATFLKAIAASKGSGEAYLGLGNFYWAVGQYPEAEKSLKKALELTPKDPKVNSTMAALYESWSRPAEAEPYLKAVVAISNDADASFVLADYYSSHNRYAEAVATLEALIKAIPAQFGEAKTRIGLIQFMAAQRPDAHKTVDEVLAREPRNASALALKARLLLADRKPDQALEVAKRAVGVDRQSEPAQLTLGRIYLALNERDSARRTFIEVLAINPHSLPAELELVELHRARKELDSALGFANQAIADHPTSVAARLARVRVLLIRPDDRPKAEADLRALVARYGASPAVFSTMGTYALSIGNSANARLNFQKALDLNPAYMEALAGIVALDISSKNFKEARARLEAVLAKNPDSADVLLLLAKVHHVAGDMDKAEEALKRTMKADPSMPEPYGLLAQLYVAQGKIEEAKKEFIEVTKYDPRYVGAPTMLGLLYYSTKDNENAQRWWEKAVAIDPQSAAASNNLAWLYAETGANLDRALELSQVAKNKMPDDPEVNDTMGWIYYKKKQSSRAISFFLHSLETDAAKPIIQYHLGLAYAQAGEDAKAGKALKLALSLDPKFPYAAEARKALSLLVY